MLDLHIRLFCCVSVDDIEPQILIKGVHLTHFLNNCSIETWFFSYEERFTYESNKAKQSIWHRTIFYSIFTMSLKFKWYFTTITKQVIQLILITLVGTVVYVRMVFVWEENVVFGGNPPSHCASKTAEWVHVDSPKYKMICLKSLNSSELANTI